MNNMNENTYNDTPYFRTYLTNVFTVLLTLYGIVMAINKPFWGMAFILSSLILWRVNSRGKLKSAAVLLMSGLLFLLISRLFWNNGLQALEHTILFILQALYFTGTIFGLGSLFSIITDMDSGDEVRHVSKYVVHGIYFLTGLIILPYCLFYFYGIIVFEGIQPELLLPVVLFFIWMLLYIIQIKVLSRSKWKAWSGISAITLITLYVLTRWAEIL